MNDNLSIILIILKILCGKRGCTSCSAEKIDGLDVKRGAGRVFILSKFERRLIMGKNVELTEPELIVFEKLKKLLKESKEIINKQELGSKKHIELNNEMAKTAHKLHIMLNRRGIEPKHHKYMLENRGVPVDDIEFYNHIHPVEDLLAFINDVEANNDPEDSTMGKSFKLRIYSRRWGHYDLYTIKRISKGWDFKGIRSGECDKAGSPYLINTLDHDFISYPHNFGKLLEWLWDKAADGLKESEVQEAVDDLGEWISICELNVPRGVFEGLL